MTKDKTGHVTKLPIGAITEHVDAEPKEPCTDAEVISILQDLDTAVNSAQGHPQEYLYVFKYPCKLERRDAQESGTQSENVLIYIKINNRKVPYKKVFIISFHKNRPKR